jgi:dihydrofolate synthase/folylpolyglutamate synthase
VSPEVAALAERTASAHGAKLISASADPGAGVQLRTPGRFQRRNFALAEAAASAFLGELDPERVAGVAAGLAIPGRLELIAEAPTTYIDAAHAAALAEALPEVAAGAPVVACIAILADKDAGEMVAALAPAVERVVCTELPSAALESQGRPGAASRPAAELAEICGKAGLPAEAVPDFATALRQSRDLAGAAPGGVLIVTGSHYALAPARAALQSSSPA